MTDLPIKLKMIYFRIIFVEVIFVIIYSIANYHFFIQPNWPVLDEATTNVLIPLGISWIPVILFVRPKFRLLNLIRSNGKDMLSGYTVLVTFGFTATLITSQVFLTLSLSKLTQLNHISDVSNYPSTKYYTVNQHFINKRDFAVYQNSRVSGKYNGTLNFYSYIACPIYNSADDTINAKQNIAPQPWLGVQYYKQINNHLPDSVKRQAEIDFNQSALTRFMHLDVEQFAYLERFGHSYGYLSYKKAIGMHTGAAIAEPLVFEAHNQPFDSHTGNSLWWILFAFFGTAGGFLAMVLLPPLDNERVAAFLPKDPGSWGASSKL